VPGHRSSLLADRQLSRQGEPSHQPSLQGDQTICTAGPKTRRGLLPLHSQLTVRLQQPPKVKRTMCTPIVMETCIGNPMTVGRTQILVLRSNPPRRTAPAQLVPAPLTGMPSRVSEASSDHRVSPGADPVEGGGGDGKAEIRGRKSEGRGQRVFS